LNLGTRIEMRILNMDLLDSEDGKKLGIVFDAEVGLHSFKSVQHCGGGHYRRKKRHEI